MKSATEQTNILASIQVKRRSVGEWIKLVVSGYLIGSGNVVPGVSGGTMAFILGVYEELVESLRMAGQPEFFRALFGFEFRKALRLVHAGFLIAMILGGLLAVLTLVPGLEWMLIYQPVIIWSFFFGLILASVVIVGRSIQRWSLIVGVGLLVGAVGAYLLVGLVPVETPEAWWFLMLSGALAICAMILPGLSGSFILVLLGKYEFFVRAVNARDFMALLWAGIGAVIGLVTFAQILSWLFKRYRDTTIAVLTGFMLGSLRKVWPWKETLEFYTDRHGVLTPLLERNVLPALQVNGQFNAEIIYALLAALLGLALVLVIERWGNHDSEKLKRSSNGMGEPVAAVPADN